MIAHRAEYLSHGQTTRHHCPIESCPWFHDEPINVTLVIPLWSTDPVGEAVRERDRRVDAVITAHCATHTAEQWAHEIARLRTEVERLDDFVRFGNSGIRPHRYADEGHAG